MEVTYDALQKQLAQAREQIAVKDQRVKELEASLIDITSRLLATFPGLRNFPSVQKAEAALGGKE